MNKWEIINIILLYYLRDEPKEIPSNIKKTISKKKKEICDAIYSSECTRWK